MATNQTFAPSCGYATRDARREWLALHGMPDAGASLSALELTADPDTSKPLYFWQLYSLIGQKRIVALVYAFYRRSARPCSPPCFRAAVRQPHIARAPLTCRCFDLPLPLQRLRR